MRPSFLLGIVTFVVYLTGSTIAEECVPSTSDPEVSAAGFYIDNDVCQPNCLFSIWLYQESNGIDGLQRGDEVHDDTCGGMIESDALPCQLLPIALMTRRRGDASSGAAITGALLVTGVAFMPTAEAC